MVTLPLLGPGGGVEAEMQLTKHSLEALQQEQSISNLPQTLQDAMTVTRDLGYEHIWIDQLCILQHDAADWEREAAQMGDVYGQAGLTIVPLAADSASSGCLVRQASSAVATPWLSGPADERSLRSIKVWTTASLPVKWENPGRQRSSAGLVTEMVESRWHTRGWTF